MTEARPLEEVLKAAFYGQWRTDLATVMGTRSDEQVGALVDRVASEQLGVPVRGALFATKSVGAVFGLELSSGEHVVLKLFDPSQSHSGLEAAHRCLKRAVEAGFPAPPARSGLFRTEDGVTGVFYALVDGAIRDGHESSVRRELARALADLGVILSRETPDELPLAATRRSELWPPAHRSFLKLKSASPDAAWVDQIGRCAQSVVKARDLPLVPAHFDWGVKNTRFRKESICAVYDWDSLVAASEAELVGRAAVQFTAQWDFSAPLTPSPSESSSFVDEYQSDRGRPFSDEERLVLDAAAEYSVAQLARLELAEGIDRGDGFLSLLRTWKRGASWTSTRRA